MKDYFVKRKSVYDDHESHIAKRNKEYDIFVQHSDAEDDEAFVRDVLLPNLELESQFKLFVQGKDFLPGIRILSNIETAITNSNATIILLSQDYIDQRWCKDEFDLSIEEHMNDNAFKLVVILMQPKQQLKGLSKVMNRFLRSTKYLEKNDPNLLEKLKRRLAQLQA